jgi:hypothetical protein
VDSREHGDEPLDSGTTQFISCSVKITTVVLLVSAVILPKSAACNAQKLNQMRSQWSSDWHLWVSSVGSHIRTCISVPLLATVQLVDGVPKQRCGKNLTNYMMCVEPHMVTTVIISKCCNCVWNSLIFFCYVSRVSFKLMTCNDILYMSTSMNHCKTPCVLFF